MHMHTGTHTRRHTWQRGLSNVPALCMHTLCQIIKIIWKCDVNQTTIELSIGYISNYITLLHFTLLYKRKNIALSQYDIAWICMRAENKASTDPFCQWSRFVFITVKSSSLCMHKRTKTNALVVEHKSKFAFQFTLFSIAFGDSGWWDIDFKFPNDGIQSVLLGECNRFVSRITIKWRDGFYDENHLHFPFSIFHFTV